MAKSPLYVHLILDRSGSMEDCRDETISAFNEYLATLALSPDADARVTLTTFDSEGVDIVADQVSARDMPKLNRDSFVPRAMTPLFDAIGKSVAHTDKAQMRDGEKVSLVILTDGMENASKEHTLQSVHALLEGRQKDKGWQIVFLGADEKSWSQGATMGAHAGSALQYSKSSMKRTMQAVYRSQSAYVSGGNSDFTEAERREANEKT